MSWPRRIGLVLGPMALTALVAVTSPLHRLEGLGHRPAAAAGVFALMAIWWFTEALPIHLTALVPLVAYPLLGVFGQGLIGDARQTALEFTNAYLFLFAGGMAVGAAMEHWGLHRRVALLIMVRIGGSPPRLLLGLLIATAAVSLWISNTATAVMMTPIGLAIVTQLERREQRRLQHYGAALMLAVAYASNVGGMGTKIGTATNSIFSGFVARRLQVEVSFVEFLAIGLPFVVLFLPVVWLALWRLGRADAPKNPEAKTTLERELAGLGPLSERERTVGLIFLAAASLWIFADPLRRLLGSALGVELAGRHFEAGVALLAAGALVVRGALPLAALRRVPVSALLLLGGSFAMAAGIEGSGLSTYLAQQLAPVRSLPPLGQLALAVGATIGLSAVASNTATLNVMLALLPGNLPLLGAVTLGASCDFALPAGTPPNAIVFGSGYIRLPVMMRTGLVLDLAAWALLVAYGLLYLPRVVG